MVTTENRTVEAGAALRADADAKRHEADTLKAVYQKAREHVDGLTVELAAMPPLKIEAITNADIEAYAHALERERILPAEITLGQIAAAKAEVTYREADKDWGHLYRSWASYESGRIGKSAGYPQGTADGNYVDSEYHNGREICFNTSRLLGAAVRQLQDLIDAATRRR